MSSGRKHEKTKKVPITVLKLTRGRAGKVCAYRERAAILGLGAGSNVCSQYDPEAFFMPVSSPVESRR